MSKKLIIPKDGPPAVGPYSPAVAANGFLFVSGQIPLNPKSGELVLNSFEAQVRQTLDNLRCVLKAGGASLDDVVKVTIFVTDLGKFGELNAIYEEYFGESKPARATVEVAALPKGVEVEMDATAALSN
ncbi:MAG: RidA family protein [Candidatus Hinthialibacter antarcticus]|nr:RidA family protein [Candidatus Hinthialibacter antarcticus]